MLTVELQYVVDSAGNRIAIIVPIEKWNEILDIHPDLKQHYGEPPSNAGWSTESKSKNRNK